MRESGIVAFGDQEATHSVGDGFRDAAVQGGEYWKPGGHGFQHGVGYTLLILVRRHFAGVQKEMGCGVEGGKSLLREEAAEFHGVGELKFGDPVGQLRFQRSIPGDDKAGLGMAFAELGKGAERGEQSLFFYEPAGLDEHPGTVRRWGALDEGEFGERNAGAVDADFFPGAAVLDEAVGKGLGACKDEWDGLEYTAHLVVIARLLGAGLDVHSVEGDDAGAVPFEDEGEEMDAGVSKVDVEEMGGASAEDFEDLLKFAPVIDRWESTEVFEPESFEEIFPGFWDFLDGIERKLGCVGALPGEHEGVVAPQACHLAVDVAHLGFEESGAVTRHHWAVRFLGMRWWGRFHWFGHGPGNLVQGSWLVEDGPGSVALCGPATI